MIQVSQSTYHTGSERGQHRGSSEDDKDKDKDTDKVIKRPLKDPTYAINNKYDIHRPDQTNLTTTTTIHFLSFLTKQNKIVEKV